MGHKILLVDDEKTSVALVKFGLSSQDYEVIVAYDGKEGLEKVEKEKPDLIVLDVHMPEMDGYEFMKELRAAQGMQTTPVLMLTANETMQSMFKLEGVKGYFVKPLKLEALVAKIVECLGPNPL